MTTPGQAMRIGTACAAVLAAACMAAAAVAQPAGGDLMRCRTIEDPAARLRCYESLPAPETQKGHSGAPTSTGSMAQMIGSWRLLRTPNPKGPEEQAAVSITRPGQLSGSDPDFAGLMIRCAETDIEVLAVLLRPLPFRARPRIAVNGAKFEGSVVPPGVTVLLPREVAMAARSDWRSLPGVSIEIAEGSTVTRGFIPLDDFDSALKALTAACSSR